MPTLDLSQRHQKMLHELLAAHVPKAEVWAYGSRVTGNGHETSDLDLVLRNPVNLKQSNDQLPDLQEAIQISMIPIIVDVHDWAHLPEPFQQEVKRCHVVIKEAKPHD